MPGIDQGRFAGTLLGAAAGESLGAPHEFKTADEVGEQREIVSGGGWAAGEPTDDIALTLVLLRSLVAHGRLDLEDVARGQLRWLATGPKDIGNLTRAALSKLRAGRPPTESGALAWEESNRHSAGNGSVMCCAPIGLLHAKDLGGLAEDAAAFSRITHFDPRCVAGCIAVTTAIACLVGGGRESRSDAEGAVEASSGATAVEAASRALAAAAAVSDEACAAIGRGVSRRPSELRVDGQDQGFVLHTLAIAFSALCSASSFEEGVVSVVARGGDTDTNGCVAGALLGARFGRRQIPERWLTKLKAGPELSSLADALYGRL
jgi:ADP-ribosyl-[dinitrogen reductase] hydrolase